MTETDFIIHSYTSRLYVGDPCLIDVRWTAKEAGFDIPVAISPALWNQCFSGPDRIEGQDERGRLWDLLCIIQGALGLGQAAGSEVHYMLKVDNDLPLRAPLSIELMSICSLNEEDERWIALMLPEEN